MASIFWTWHVKYGRARFALFAVFIFFLTLNFFMVVYAWQKYWANTATMVELLKQIVTIYSVHFGVILAGIFAMRSPREDRPPGQMFSVALILVLIWNLMVTWPLFYLVTKAGPEDMDIDWHVNYWKTVPEMTSFLVTAALTYFFVRREQQATAAAERRLAAAAGRPEAL